jgi:hypothetical protein
MRIFGRSRKTAGTSGSASDRMGGMSNSSAARALEPLVTLSDVRDGLDEGDLGGQSAADLAVTDEMPAYPGFVSTEVIESVESTTGADGDGDSDVFVCRRTSSPDLEAAAVVTLFVYGWENVEPGPLSWVFPSLRAALDAVRTMRNAIEWCIVAGNEWTNIDVARANGAVLIEQNA